MRFDEAKLAILDMADKINTGTFTQSDLVTFVLAFRVELFESQKSQAQIAMGNFPMSCSCASTVDSCNECGPGHMTLFTEHNGQIISFKTKKDTE